MPKGYCRQPGCGSWENLHKDGLCHVHHYGQPEGGAFPTAATPEAVARETATQLVDVDFPPATGPYFDTRRQEADEARQRAEAEPLLGKLTQPDAATSDPINRVSPAGADADDRRRDGAALPAEVKAAVANAEGMQRDAAELAEPPRVGTIDARQAGDADKKGTVKKH